MKKEFDGNIAVLSGSRKGLAAAYEMALLLLYKKGCEIKTQYDNPEDPPSKDATMTIIVKDPTSEPRIHKAFPGGIEDLQEYKMEMIEGIKDTWIREQTDPLDDRWEYTYHGRICNREMPVTEAMKYLQSLSYEIKQQMGKRGMKVLLDMPWAKLKKRKVENKLEEVVAIDQLEACIDMLTRNPHTRRAQMITWQPEEDLVSYDPACLQRIWLRMSKANDGIYRLNMNVDMRSNDAWGASFMNMFAFTLLDKYIATRISENRKEPIKLGRYFHKADSFHIYGKDLKKFKELLLNRIGTTKFEDRVYKSNDPLIQEIMQEAKPIILGKVAKKTERYLQER